MDYLAKFYKNQSEVLAEQVRILEAQLEQLMEDAPASTFSGTGAGQQRFSDSELEKQMFRHKRTGFFGAEVPDEKQSREYLDAKAELERRRGAARQAPAPAAPRPPVEQMGPVGSPSAVPTRTEVQRTQAVADRTQMPTALPTNVAPGTMHMTDMDGNPIAVQPNKPKQSKLSPKQFNAAAGAKQVAMEVEVDADGEYMTSPSGYAQSPTSWAARHPSHYEPSTGSRFARVQAGPSAGERKDLENSAMGRGEYARRSTPIVQPSSNLPPVPASLYGTPPSAQFAPTTSSLQTSNPEIGRAVQPREIQNTPRSSESMAIDAVARQSIPSPVRDTLKAADEDFSKFWAGKPRYGDLELENMMRKFKKTNMFGPAIPDEKQSIEYRAAKAELKRRGKLK